MFSKVLVTLTSVFLILQVYIPVTSATPASAGKAQNTTQSLAPRALGDGCAKPLTWFRRECVSSQNGPSASATGWEDVCGRDNKVIDRKAGSCVGGTYCLDIYGMLSSTQSIICVPVERRTGVRATDALTGSSFQFRSRRRAAVMRYDYHVKIDHDMTAASVSAVLQGECHTVNVHFLMFLCSSRDSIEFS